MHPRPSPRPARVGPGRRRAWAGDLPARRRAWGGGLAVGAGRKIGLGIFIASLDGGVKAQYRCAQMTGSLWMDPADRLLRRGLRLAHLRLLALLPEARALGVAAARLGLTQPAASRLLAEAERLAGLPLRARSGRGIALTPEGEAFARRAARALAEIGAAEREMAELGRGLSGQLRLGSVTGAALERLLPALAALRAEAPGLAVEVEVAPSEPLAEFLLAGRLDFALARLPEGRESLFDWRPVADEPVALVARRGHPLALGPPPDAARLAAQDWILPPPGALLRRLVLARLAELGQPAPRVGLSTASVMLTLAALMDGDAIAPLARAVVARFAQGPQAGVVALPADLGLVVPTYGIVTLRDARLTPAARRLADLAAGVRPGPSRAPPAARPPA
jgi:DNA-binding transcriptional LysR family regulator